MCEAFDYYESRGRQKRIQEEQKWLLDAIKRNMSEGFSFQQIMKIFGISQDEQNYYFQKLQEE